MVPSCNPGLAPPLPGTTDPDFSSFWRHNCDALLTYLGVLEMTAVEQHQRYAVAYIQELREVVYRFENECEMKAMHRDSVAGKVICGMWSTTDFLKAPGPGKR